MNIYYDFELEQKNVTQTRESKAFTDEIRNVISERLQPLADEMAKEENSASQKPMVLIKTDPEFKVVFFNYSRGLSSKIADSLNGLSPYIKKRLDERNSSLNN
jgi:hypothetical protein